MSNPNTYFTCDIWTSVPHMFTITISGPDLADLKDAMRQGWPTVEVMRVTFEDDLCLDVGPIVLRPAQISAIVADEI